MSAPHMPPYQSQSQYQSNIPVATQPRYSMLPPKQESNEYSAARAYPISDSAYDLNATNDYSYDARPAGKRRSTFNPKTWSKRTWIIVAIAAVVCLIAIIVGAVLGVRANRYPDYSYIKYDLQDSYQGNSFFDNFQYFNAEDPAGGSPLIYNSRVDAMARNVTRVNSAGNAVMQLNLDWPTVNNVTFAQSARIHSTTTYNSGLFLFDVLHAPYGCAVWPAVWLSNSYNWPNDGEIDVIEAVNKADTGVQTTLHTTKGCTMGVKRKMTGKSMQTSCLNSTNSNAGCGVQGPQVSYGAALNAAGGGVYALEWRDAGIRTWFWERAQIPSDVTAALASTVSGSASAHPDPTAWGEALADFPATDCDVASHFRNASLIANIDVCGQWAGQTSVFNQGGCPGSCVDYVQNNRGAFGQAYWEFGSWKAFAADGASARVKTRRNAGAWGRALESVGQKVDGVVRRGSEWALEQ